jgi:hypothetical protein
MFWCCARLGSAYFFRMGSAVGVMVFWSRFITALQQQQQQEVGSAGGSHQAEQQDVLRRSEKRR